MKQILKLVYSPLKKKPPKLINLNLAGYIQIFYSLVHPGIVSSSKLKIIFYF